MLKKQSIRDTEVFINNNKKPASKDEIITLSEDWSESEVNLFKRLLKQGGYVRIKGIRYRLVVPY